MRVKMTITAENRAREVYIDNFEELSEQDIFEIAKRELDKIPRSHGDPDGPPGTPGDDYRLTKGLSPIFIPKRKKFKRRYKFKRRHK